MHENDMQHGRDWMGEDLAGWLLSEKLDGVRAEWDGARLWTRSGRELAVPSAWQLPAGVALSGEIYAGRATFDRVNTAVRLNRLDASLRFIAFDAPGGGTWTQRMSRARAVWSDCVEIITCRSTDHALELLAQVQAVGGEGLVAVHPAATWRKGRTGALLKVKTALAAAMAA
jgi:DNA ligase-1